MTKWACGKRETSKKIKGERDIKKKEHMWDVEKNVTHFDIFEYFFRVS